VSKGLTAVENTWFEPHNAGTPSRDTYFFTMNELLDPGKKIFSAGYFKIIIDEKTPALLKGRLAFDDGRGLRLDAGLFALDAQNPACSGTTLNIAYNTYMSLRLELKVEP
jgi:hypothetical protein